MAWVYILRGDSGRHYIGSTTKLERRFKDHRRGHAHSTKRLGGNLEIVAAVELADLDEARALEREMKHKKNPQLALALLQRRLPEPVLPLGVLAVTNRRLKLIKAK
jgi:predicted GIY-YIG superfamily endonuclease